MSLFDKIFPTEDKKLQAKVEELQKEIAALENRRNLILEETKKFVADRDEAMEVYEFEKEKVEKKRKLLGSFDDSQIKLMRHQVIKEIYHRSTHFESSAIRDVRENFDRYSLEEIKSILSPSKYAHRGILDFMESIMLPEWAFFELVDDYIKLCFEKFGRQLM